LRTARGEHPDVDSFFVGQFFGLFQTDRHAHLRLDQQAAVGQEPGKEHSVPVFVGALARQVIDLEAAGAVLPVAELSCPGAEVVAQGALVRGHVLVRLIVVDGQGFQGRARAGLGHVAGLDDHAFQVTSEIGWQSWHGAPLRKQQPFE